MTDYDKQPTTREKILYNGAKLTSGDRNATYGEPVQNMQDIAALWSVYITTKYRGKTLDELNFQLSGQDVAHMNTLMKIARSYKSAAHFDNYVDGATYQAIAGECAYEEEPDAE